VASLGRIELEGGGSILVELREAEEGPVKAGRIADAIHDLPKTLQEQLTPVATAARTMLQTVRIAGPTEVEIGFGVDLSFQAGTVITKGETACHLTVKLTWKQGDLESGRA
jgi:hypothetical protein